MMIVMSANATRQQIDDIRLEYDLLVRHVKRVSSKLCISDVVESALLRPVAAERIGDEEVDTLELVGADGADLYGHSEVDSNASRPPGRGR